LDSVTSSTPRWGIAADRVRALDTALWIVRLAQPRTIRELHLKGSSLQSPGLIRPFNLIYFYGLSP
jgi:hypothetical protein